LNLKETPSFDVVMAWFSIFFVASWRGTAVTELQTGSKKIPFLGAARSMFDNGPGESLRRHGHKRHEPCTIEKLRLYHLLLAKRIQIIHNDIFWGLQKGAATISKLWVNCLCQILMPSFFVLYSCSTSHCRGRQ
jgi:hypothetical protein